MRKQRRWCAIFEEPVIQPLKSLSNIIIYMSSNKFSIYT